MRESALLVLAVAAAAASAALLSPRPLPSPPAVALRGNAVRALRTSRLVMALAEPEEDGDELQQNPSDEQLSREEKPTVDMDMSKLAQRISNVQEKDNLEARLESLEQAWVLVFDVDTEEEAVYSMEMHEEDGAHVVLAFECSTEAKLYAETLKEEAYDTVASVQALDVEALVITSREADFRVGVVFKGDLEADKADMSQFITSVAPDPDRLSLSITIVPEHIFEGRSSADFLDPAEDPVWVLVHDEGTGDAQYFSMTLNGTSSIVCFKDAEAAERCSTALQGKGTAVAATRSLLLEELLDDIADDDVEVCLVDEVVETLIEDDGSGTMPGPGIVAADAEEAILGTYPDDGRAAAQETSVVPNDVRAMLDRLYDGDAGGEDGPQA